MNVSHRGLVPPPMVVVLRRSMGRIGYRKAAIGTDLSCFENLISGSPYF
jgi:hypothetical protein